MTRPLPVSDPAGEGSPRHSDRVIISTDSVAPSDRFEWWRSEFSSLHKVEVAKDRRQTFKAHGEHWLLGPILIGRYRTPARRVVRTPVDIRRSDADHWVLRVATKGVVLSRGSFGGYRAFPGQVSIGSFAWDYSDDYSVGEWIAAMIPRHVLPALDVWTARPGPRVLTGVKSALLADFLISLVQRLPETKPFEMPAIAEMTRVILTAHLTDDDIASVAATPEVQSIVKRERLDRVIRDNLASARLNPKRICALVGISRSALYRLFEDRGGVAAHLQALRLEQAYANLSDPQLANRTIADLAAGCGLHNASAFTRMFRRRFGCTPSDVRAAAFCENIVPPGHLSVPQGQRFADLLG